MEELIRLLFVLFLTVYSGIRKVISYPFVVIHELSHYIAIRLAGLPVKEAVFHRILSQRSKELADNHIAGYVKYPLPKEPVVSTIIGIAPLLVGLALYSVAFPWIAKSYEYGDIINFVILFLTIEFFIPSPKDVEFKFVNVEYAINSLVLLPLTLIINGWFALVGEAHMVSYVVYLFLLSLALFFAIKCFWMYMIVSLALAFILLLMFRWGFPRLALKLIFYGLFPFSLVFIGIVAYMGNGFPISISCELPHIFK